MHIALCLYGRSPFETEGLEILLSQLQGYTTCDLFVYLWKQTKAEDLNRLKMFQKLCSTNVRLINATFADCSVIEMNEDDCELAREVYRNFYARKQCCLEREYLAHEYGLNHDMIVMCQSGVVLNRAITLPKYSRYIDSDCIILPDNTHKSQYIPVEERFSMGSADAMLLYSCAYDFIEEYVFDENHGCRIIADPGWIMLKHLNKRHSQGLFVHGNFRSGFLSQENN